MQNDIPDVGTQIPRGAVSIYPQGDAMDDFPVLKAFQQYVDAEHAKAQKRMTTLCIFFVVLMVAVIGVFVLLLMSISQRNNSLSDQLFQFMLKDRDRQNVIVQSPAPARESDSSEILAFQKQLFDQQMKFMEESMKARPAPVSAPVPESERAQFAAQKLAHERKAKSEDERLAKTAAVLQAQADALAKERERLRLKEIDLQRRNLYPDFYRNTPAAPARSVNNTSAPAPVPVEDDDADLALLDAEIASEARKVADQAAKPAQKPAAPAAPPAPSAGKDDIDELVDTIDAPVSLPDGAQWSMPPE